MKKVLVIEDNKDNLMLISYPLRQSSYDVVSTETGEEGIELARSLKDNLAFIIMDINLPGIDGIETTKRIRNSEIGNTIPIIAITSYAMLGDRDKILSAGCDGYFEKPIDPTTIVEKIHAIIKKQNSEVRMKGE